MNAPEKIRLTEFSHGGGCGCKIAPAILSEILSASPIRGLPADLLVGTETSDDAAVYKLNESQALVATTDFFTPIVDDPYDFGRIAATNAISDIYAMGGRPIMALADMPAVHALTDVTGFGLAGHLLEMCRGAKAGAEVNFDALPVIPEALDWAKQGVATGASDRNWKGYGAEVDLPAGFAEWKRKLMADPQTSGGLLVACAPEAVPQVLKAFNGDARPIGRFVAGAPRLRIT